MSYVIGSFNLRDFGDGAIQSRDLVKIAEIIKNEKFDVVALQEIFNEGNAFINNNVIKYELGDEWEFQWADAENEKFHHEGYGYLWNKRRLGLAKDNGKPFQPRIWEKPSIKGLIKRPPFFARFTPVESLLGGPYFELRLICIHTFFGSGQEIDVLLRNFEIETVLTEIYTDIEDIQYNSMPSYTFVLGDYNVQLKRAWKESTIRDNAPYLEADANDVMLAEEYVAGELIRVKKIITVQDQLTTLKKPKKDGETGSLTYQGGYAHDYDHFSYNLDRFSGVNLKWKRIDAVKEYFNGDYKLYHEKVSDHIPISMEMELRGISNFDLTSLTTITEAVQEDYKELRN